MKKILLTGLGVLLLTGCHHRISSKPVGLLRSPTNEPNFRGGMYANNQKLDPAYFELDEAILSLDDLSLLKKNERVLEAHPEWKILIEGNCDERGSEGYNLGLGQLRAKAIRDYYMALGVDGNRIATVSNGKERPICEEHTEECWERNRKADTKIR